MEKIIIAGFGGQGIMSMGQMLAYAGMTEDKNVTWLPSYGPEMRGGTANCHVVVSESEVASPMITKASTVIVMNLPSLEKFEKNVVPGGKLFINKSLIDKKSTRDDIDVYYIDANNIASDLGNLKIANMVILGAFLEVSKIVSTDSVIKALEKVLGKGKRDLIDINKEALFKGALQI